MRRISVGKKEFPFLGIFRQEVRHGHRPEVGKCQVLGNGQTYDPASKLLSGSGSASWCNLTTSESSRGLDETQINGLHFLSVWFSRTWVGLRICLFNKSLDDADCWCRDHSLTKTVLRSKSKRQAPIKISILLCCCCLVAELHPTLLRPHGL